MLEPAYRKGRVYNIIGTLARHPAASRAIGQVSNHVMGPGSTLTARERELLILRTAWLCQAEYEWAQHALLGAKAGLSAEDIARCKRGPAAAGWSGTEASLLRAADELHAVQCISDSTWAELAEHYEQRQLMDIVFAVGQYTLVAMALNSFATPLDAGLEGF
jgi:alkylhydroperoxidase family enzyme